MSLALRPYGMQTSARWTREWVALVYVHPCGRAQEVEGAIYFLLCECESVSVCAWVHACEQEG